MVEGKAGQPHGHRASQGKAEEIEAGHPEGRAGITDFEGERAARETNRNQAVDIRNRAGKPRSVPVDHRCFVALVVELRQLEEGMAFRADEEIDVRSVQTYDSFHRQIAFEEADYQYAETYLFIIYIGLFTQVFYNMMVSVLHSIGDSFTPLLFLIGSTILNIALDFACILLFKWGVAGAALATIFSQFVAFVACLIYSLVKYPFFRANVIERLCNQQSRPRFSSGVAERFMMLMKS